MSAGDSAIGDGVAHAYSTAFDFSSGGSAEKVAVIEDGTSIDTAIDYVLSSSLAGSATGAHTQAVDLLTSSECDRVSLSNPCTAVTYDLLGPNHMPLFSAHSHGHAVSVGGRWLVAKATACEVLHIFYSALGTPTKPAGC